MPLPFPFAGPPPPPPPPPPAGGEVWGWTEPGGTEVSLAQPWLGISTFGGSRAGVPVLRGADYEIPFRSGASWRAKFPGPRTVTLVMWTAGIDQDTGQPSDDQILAWNDNFNSIKSMFWTRGPNGSVQGILTRRWRLTQTGTPQIVVGQAMAEIGGSMEPTMTGRTRADFSVDLVLSDPYFYGPAQQQNIGAGSTQTLTNTGQGTVGEGYPSTVNSFTIVFNGPLTSPVLTNLTALNASSGPDLSLSYLGIIPPGGSVVVDVLANSARTDGGANVVSLIEHAGARVWFSLVKGDNQVSLSTLNGADTGNAVLSWNPPYT